MNSTVDYWTLDDEQYGILKRMYQDLQSCEGFENFAIYQLYSKLEKIDGVWAVPVSQFTNFDYEGSDLDDDSYDAIFALLTKMSYNLSSHTWNSF